MGKLKPIGSEKLEGFAKINRMIELAKYKENKPQNINEDNSNEYGIRLADGLKYHIVKEKSGYVIKKGLNESNLDYVEPIKGRKYYSSYSQALKRLNLITKEVNLLEGNDKNISLFTEGEEGEKKYYLSMKRETTEQAPPAPAPAPAPAAAPPTPAAAPPTPAPAPSGEPEMTGVEDDVAPEGEDVPEEPETDEPQSTPEEETVTFKSIQKLTGKLGQKLRTLNSNEDTKMSSKDVKYVINSILSALDLNNLEDDDREEIMSKLEGVEDEGMESGDMDTDIEEPQGEEDGEEVSSEPVPQPPSDEMTEMDFSMMDDEDEDYMGEISMRGMGRDESYKMEEMIEGIFSESKVDKILKRYFKLEKKEKNHLSERKKEIKNVIRLSETVSQQVAARKFLNENKDSKFLGKSNLKNLCFQSGDKKFMITKKGEII